MARAWIAGALTLAVSLAGAPPAHPGPAGSPPARAAVWLCTQSDQAPEDERSEFWRHGLAVAESALARNPDDPVAHFAVFCNLGKRASAEGLGAGTLAAVPRLREHIDRALALDPDYAEALAAKGAFLAHLPALLGGDVEEGERLLRRSLELDPANGVARRELAHLLQRDGRDAEASTELERAERPVPPTSTGRATLR